MTRSTFLASLSLAALAFGGGCGGSGSTVAADGGGSRGTLTIADTTMEGNTGGSWTNVSTGSVKNAGTAVGTNTKSITITSSMIQGYPRGRPRTGPVLTCGAVRC